MNAILVDTGPLVALTRIRDPLVTVWLVLARQGTIPKHILLDDRRAKATPCEAMKSYLGCVSGGPADLAVETGQKFRTLLQRPRGKS